MVVSLGDADIPKKHQEIIASAVEKRLYQQKELFPWDYEPSVQKWIDLIIRKVDLQGRWRPLEALSEKKSELADGVPVDEVEHDHNSGKRQRSLPRQEGRKTRRDAKSDL